MKKNIKNFNIVVFASGGGGNFQSLIDHQIKIGYKITLLVTDKECLAIERAKSNNIPYFFANKNKLKKSFFYQINKHIPINTNLIVLAGFMSILDKNFCQQWQGKIINTHPSLLPKYGGKGMYGVKVQESVMKAKEKKAGCTVHFVNKDIDKGQIIIQKSINVNYNETPWELGGRIHEEEKKLLPKAIKIIMNKLKNE
jgi:phosphoribosylglycinamide formyltransferase 1